MNTTTIKKLAEVCTSRAKSHRSSIFGLIVNIHHVYGRNLVTASASEAKLPPRHWAVSTCTCGRKASICSRPADESSSEDCPECVVSEVNLIALSIARRIEPNSSVAQIRDVCMNLVNVPCVITIQNKTERVEIEVQHESAKGNSSSAEKKHRAALG